MSEKYLGEEGTSRLIAKVKGYSQPRTLVSPITIGGTSQTTVESALGALNNVKLEQVTSMPTASAAYLNKVYLFVGTTTADYKQGCTYMCKSDGGDPATYSWELLTGDVPVDDVTITKDVSTGELTAVQATTSTLGVVKGGDGTQISNAGGINVVNRLVVTDTLPTASVDYLNAVRLFVGTTGGYMQGGIYMCKLVAGSDPAEYTWELISQAEVDLSEYKKIFVGDSNAWSQLSTAEKKEYDEADITDDVASGAMIISDSVTEGDMNPVTSNAVSKYGIRFNLSGGSGQIPDIARTFIKFRKPENIVTMDIQDANQTGVSIDFDYSNGAIRFYKMVDGSPTDTWTFNYSSHS